MRQGLLLSSVNWLWGSPSQTKHYISNSVKDTHSLKYKKICLLLHFFPSTKHTNSNHDFSVLGRGKERFHRRKMLALETKQNKNLAVVTNKSGLLRLTTCSQDSQVRYFFLCSFLPVELKNCHGYFLSFLRMLPTMYNTLC